MKTDYQVIIVGGGPVGLTLAIDLGQRGVKCLLIEKRAAPSSLPKMERCHPRTMEHFRRLGIAEQVRAAGYPENDPLDAFLVTSLAEEPIARMARPSVAEARESAKAANDGKAAAEPHLIISQYALEPVLKEIAEKTPSVDVRFGAEFVSLQEHSDHVSVRIQSDAGEEYVCTALYLAGCDGATSPVRHAIGCVLEGQPNLREQSQALFRCEDLFDRIPMGKGAHYYLADDRWTFLITQGDTRQFSMHAIVDDVKELPELFERFVGMPLAYETLYLGKWTMRLMLADRYASQRVFLAGDAVHLVTPIGGLGMNTGIGDAIDLAWKLDAAVNGWAGSDLLKSYEYERRQIGARNMAAAERAYLARQSWRDACDADLEDLRPGLDNDALRQELGEIWQDQHKKATSLAGIILGYRYLDSPIIFYDAADNGDDQDSYEYTPSTLPGLRIPQFWLSDGSAMQDHAGLGFTLVHCGGAEADYTPLLSQFFAIGCPLQVLDLTREDAARRIYADNYILLRPDLHIAWRGQTLPADMAGLVNKVTGHGMSPVPSSSTHLSHLTNEVHL